MLTLSLYRVEVYLSWVDSCTRHGYKTKQNNNYHLTISVYTLMQEMLGLGSFFTLYYRIWNMN